MNPRDIAAALHVYYGLPITSNEIECFNMEYVVTNACEIVNDFFNELLHIERRVYPILKKSRISSHDVSLKCGRTREERIESGPIVK